MTAVNTVYLITACSGGFLTLMAMLWKLSASIVRHIDATRANTNALAALGTTLTSHITRSDARAQQHETRIRRLERLNHVSP